MAAAGLEWCGVANYSQRYMGGQMQAWGWSDTRCTTMGPFICKASPSMLAPSFTSKFTNSTFRLATYPSSFAAAQLGCNQLGGHLATYQLLQEQVGQQRALRGKAYMLAGACTLLPAAPPATSWHTKLTHGSCLPRPLAG